MYHMWRHEHRFMKTHSDLNAANYLDTLVSNSFLPAITLPTRVTKTSSTLIDHIFKRISQTEFFGGTIEYDISDHNLNFILLKTVYSKPPKCNVTFRNTCNNNLNNFKNALQKEKWNFIDECHEANIAYNNLLISIQI